MLVGAIVAIMHVFVLPPNESRKSLVSLLSLREYYNKYDSNLADVYVDTTHKRK